MIEDLKSIKNILPKIEKIDKTVTAINVKVYDKENKLGQLENRVEHCERICSFMNEEYEKQKQDMKKAESVVKHLEKSCDDLKSTMKTQSIQFENTLDKLAD